MKLKERDIINNIDFEKGETKSPINNITRKDISRTERTLDSKDIFNEYVEESFTEDSTVITGARIPKDLTVRLVRFDSSLLELIIIILVNVFLALTFFLIGYSVDNKLVTPVEKFLTILMICFTAILIVVWIVIKVRQNTRSYLIPSNALEILSGEKRRNDGKKKNPVVKKLG